MRKEGERDGDEKKYTKLKGREKSVAMACHNGCNNTITSCPLTMLKPISIHH